MDVTSRASTAFLAPTRPVSLRPAEIHFPAARVSSLQSTACSAVSRAFSAFAAISAIAVFAGVRRDGRRRRQRARTDVTVEADKESFFQADKESFEGGADAVETMMEVHVIGLSHHKADVEVRQKLAVPEHEWNNYAKELVHYSQRPDGPLVPEVAVISTCNRFELYFASQDMRMSKAVECVKSFLCQTSGLTREELEPYLFTYSGGDAVNHLFEVSSGLDSLVLGEAQILAQVKACHEHAIKGAVAKDGEAVAGSGGKIVAKMLNAAIRTGKMVRTATKIGQGSVSVSSAAVELMMTRSMTDLRKPSSKVSVCIIGAGKMSRLLLLALFSKHREISVTLINRSVEKAQALLNDEMVKGRGGSNAKAAGLDQMMEAIRSSDVVFTATASKDPIISPDDLRSLERNLMLIDISVPRSVARSCSGVMKVFSYSVDDLKKVVQANAEKRQHEVTKAKRLIAAEGKKFKVWQASQGAVPYIAALQAMAEGIRHAETDKMSQRLQGLHEKERQAVEKLTRHILDNLFRPLYYSMKEAEDTDAKRDKIWALKEMFRLEPLYKRGILTQGSRTSAGAVSKTAGRSTKL